LTSARAGHLLIASPSPESITEMLYFQKILQRQRLPISGMIINRSLARQSTLALSAYLEQNQNIYSGDSQILQSIFNKIAPLAKAESEIVENHRHTITKLRQQNSSTFVVAAPHIGDEISDLGGLLKLAQSL
jgi:MinD-like ATPase involved in chromosome partitioning or flagellar assembly